MILFEEMGLQQGILKAIGSLGYVTPTPIQEKVIPLLLQKPRDIVALAQTGTGKTAAFGLPVIQQIDPALREVQALVLAPTRELCLQITNDLNSFALHTPGTPVVPVYGGASAYEQIRKLEQGARIVVATPGRAVDLIKRGKLRINHIRWLILDEADEMLSMGFREELDFILAETPSTRHTLLFSATMPQGIMGIATRSMHHPEEISAGRKNQGAEHVSHEYFLVHARDRYEVLKRIADINPRIYGIVFCRTRVEAREIADNLIRDGYNADSLHGDLSQEQRDIVMNRFRLHHLQLLVATDVAARGLDVNDLTHVINYNLPDDPEVYIHRSGRTGRAGKKGISISILHLKEKGKLKTIERMAGCRFEHRPVPQGKEICEKQLFNLIDKVEKVEVNDSQIDRYLEVIYKKLEWLDRQSLIKHFVSVEFNRFLSSYQNAPDLNVESLSVRRESDGAKDGKDRKRGGKGDDKATGRRKENARMADGQGSRKYYDRYFLNLGKNDQIGKREILHLINRQMPGKSVDIGQIEVLKDFSFLEVDQRYGWDLRKAFDNARFNGKRIGLEAARPGQGTGRR